jgi:DDE family transposase
MQSIKLSPFTRDLFDDATLAQQAARILHAQLKAQSPRLTDIARQMRGQADSNYKQLQRFLHKVDLKAVLWRLFQSEAAFVIGDVTEIPRPHARKTTYVGTLKDGKTRGFWTLVLGTPFRGRALPFHFITYSSRTIAQEATSRNQEHMRALADVKALVGEKPVVLDREFSYEELLAQFVAAQLHFVIRLNLGSHAPIFYDEQGRRVELSVARSETVVYQHVCYRGQVRVNLIGTWQAGFSEPLWVMTDLPPQRGLHLYLERMKIEQTFRDLKSLLHLDKLMNKQHAAMEQVIALVLLAFSLGALIGEQFKDEWCTEQPSAKRAQVRRGTRARAKAARRKRQCYSGPFILLKLKLSWSAARVKRIVRQAYQQFKTLLFPPVRSFV